MGVGLRGRKVGPAPLCSAAPPIGAIRGRHSRCQNAFKSSRSHIPGAHLPFRSTADTPPRGRRSVGKTRKLDFLYIICTMSRMVGAYSDAKTPDEETTALFTSAAVLAAVNEKLGLALPGLVVVSYKSQVVRACVLARFRTPPRLSSFARARRARVRRARGAHSKLRSSLTFSLPGCGRQLPGCCAVERAGRGARAVHDSRLQAAAAHGRATRGEVRCRGRVLREEKSGFFSARAPHGQQ